MSNIAAFVAGASSNVNAGGGGGGGGAGAAPAGVLPGGLTVDDVFSAYTYTGNRNSQNINNNINLVNQLAITYGRYLPDQQAYTTSFFDTAGNRYHALLAVDGGTIANVGGALNLIVYKYSSTGAFLYTFKRDVGSFISTSFTPGINPLIGTVDASGNVFIVFNAQVATIFYFNDNNDYTSFINVSQRTTSQTAGIGSTSTAQTLIFFTSLVASNGNLYLGGSVNSGSTYFPIALRVGYTSSAGTVTLGAISWTRQFNTAGQTKAQSPFASVQAIMLNPTGNTVYIVMGYINEIILMQLNAATGANITVLRYAIPATLSNSSMICKLTLSPNGNLILTGPGSTLPTSTVRVYTIANDTLTLINNWQFNQQISNLVNSSLFTVAASDNSIYIFGSGNGSTLTIVRLVPTTGVTWAVTFTNNIRQAFNITDFIVSGLTLTVFLTTPSNLYNLFIEIPTDGNIGNPITIGTGVGQYTVTVLGIGGAGAVAAAASTSSVAPIDLDLSNANAGGFGLLTTGSTIFINTTAPIGSALGRLVRVNQPAVTSNGGMIWTKIRDTPVAGGSQSHAIYDTVRGLNAASNLLETNSSAASLSGSGTSGITGFYNGYQLNTDTAQSHINFELLRYISWTFRRAANFFDVILYNGNGGNQTLNHGLGVTPGMIMFKTNTVNENWAIYHRGAGRALNIPFNNISSSADTTFVANSNPTATQFFVGANALTNQASRQTIAYLFAHDPSPTGVIQCGSVTASGATATVTLGWEPQFVIFKGDDFTRWLMFDANRGFATDGVDNVLYTESNGIENSFTTGDLIDVTPTGMVLKGLTSGVVYYYMAIRRSSSIPTNGAEVFQPLVRLGVNGVTSASLPFRPDLLIGIRNSAAANIGYIVDSVRGGAVYTNTQGVNNELSSANPVQFTSQGVTFGNNSPFNDANSKIEYYFRRARNFLEIFQYTGNGVDGRVVSHGLAAVPRLILLRNRTITTTTYGQFTSVISSISGFAINTANFAQLNSTSDVSAASMTLTNVSIANTLNERYVAYLFGNVPGVCNIGTYTGDGAAVGQIINCGFSNGARFILIKALNANGNIWVFDTARGITTLTDSAVNLTGDGGATVQNGTTEVITPHASGFRVTGNDAPFLLNTNGTIYGYMAIS